MGNKVDTETYQEEYGKEYVHVCKLPREVEVISYFVPDTDKIRQWFRKSCLISSNVSHRRLCIKSHRALEQDRAIHLTQHYYVIHPFSSFRFYWELFMIWVYLLQLMITPCIIITEESIYNHVFWISIGLQLLVLSNMVIQFMSGYFEPATRNIILEPHLTVKHYLKTFFLPDLLGNYPVEIFFFLGNYKNIVSRGIMLKVIFNVFGFIDYSERFREKRQYPLCTYRLLQFMFIYAIGMMWLTALLGIAVYLDQHIIFNFEMWWLFANNVFVLVFSLGQTEFILHGFELYVHFVAITFGFIMRNIIIGKWSTIAVIRKNTVSTEFEEVEKNLYKIWFEADIFKLCTPQVVQSLVFLLKKEIYLANDVIYTSGARSDFTYFLKCGTVALYTEDDLEVLHVREGWFFSDSALILDKEMKNEYTAIAVEASEIYKLHREDFREVIQHFPEEYKIILGILDTRRAFIEQQQNNFTGLRNYYEAAGGEKKGQ